MQSIAKTHRDQQRPTKRANAYTVWILANTHEAERIT